MLMHIATLAAGCLLGICLRCGNRSFRTVCGDCTSEPSSRFTTPCGLQVHGLGLYGSALGPLVQRLKYHEETYLAVALGHALAQLLPEEWKPSLVMPIPLHPTRLADRGYNQAALLARILCRHRGLVASTGRLTRSRSTAPQAQLNRSARVANTFGAFEAKPGKGEVLLIDDVATTGNTIDACTQALHRSGYRVLGALCVALAREDTVRVLSAGPGEPEHAESVPPFVPFCGSGK
jgi:ComF family protein